MKKLLSLVLIVAFLLSFAVINVSAACSLSVTLSKSTVYIGDTVTVTLSFTGSESIESIDGLVSFDDSKLEYKSFTGGFGDKGILTPVVSGKTIKFSDVYMGAETMPKTYSVKVTFQAKTVGDAKVTVTSSDVGGSSDTSIGAPTGSTTISIKQENKSSNANLKWLTVPSGCTLVPKFSKDVTNYTCTVPGSVTSFPMDWETEDSKATTKVSEGYQLKVGENTRTVTVTAEDGTKKVYTVKITRLKPDPTPVPTPTPEPTPEPTPVPTQEPIKVTVNEKEFLISSSITVTIPEGYNKTTIMYGTEDIEAAVLGDITVVQLNDGENSALFIYNEQNKELKPYKTISSTGEIFTLLDEKPEALPESFQAQNKVIENTEATVWPFDQFGEGYYIVHVMNNNGAKYPAVYCEADGSIQKLSLKALETKETIADIEKTPEPIINNPNKNTKDNLKIDWLLVAIIISALVLVAIIIIIIVIASKNSKQKKQQEPKRQWGFEDPFDINIELNENEKQQAFAADDEDFS